MGKSTAAKMLQEMDIPVHDSDASVHKLLGAGGAAVVRVGTTFPDALKKNDAGAFFIDRSVLGRIIFNDAAKKRELENILHPMVRAESDAFKEEMRKKGHDIIALDIPLLFETGGEKRVDVTLCVSAPENVQRDRVMLRPGMTSEKFARIVAGQMPDAEKRRRADYIVESGSGFDDMKAQLQRIIATLRAS